MEIQCDVLVAGGGPAGMIAAAASSQCGANTVLVERYAFAGGLASGGLVCPISEFRMNGSRLIGSIPWSFIELLESMGGCDTSYPNGNIPFDSGIYKAAADELLRRSGVNVLFRTELIGCTMDGRRIGEAVCHHYTGLIYIKAKYFIDATGDGVLAYHAHAPFLSDGPMQPASLCMKISNVDKGSLGSTRLMEHGRKYSNQRIRKLFEELREKGEDVPLFGGPWFQEALDEGTVYANMTRSAVSIDDPFEASRMEADLRRDAYRLFSMLKDNVPEFRDSHIIELGVQAGYRETRRIRGNHVLSGEEILSGTRFPDSIAATAHPLDIHIASSSAQSVTFLSHPGFIPYRCLYTDTIDNLLAAGRIISCDRNAFASTRVQAPCMATGEAAGRAAAYLSESLCAVSEADADRIRKDTGIDQIL